MSDLKMKKNGFYSYSALDYRFFFGGFSPVVMRADLIAEGLQSGWKDLT